MLQEFISLVERYDPEFSRKIRGASPEEIRQLEELVGQSLPARYRDFLAQLGKDMGGLEIEGVDLGIERIIRFYESGEWTPPSGYILLGVQGEDPCLDYYLECTDASAQDCPIVRFPSEGAFSKENYFYPIDPSLNDFLLSLAFSEKRMESFKLQRVLMPASSRNVQAPEIITAPAELASIIDERAKQLGFDRVAKSSTAYRFYDQENAALYVRYNEAAGSLGLTVAANTSKDLERISDILSNKTSLTPA